MSAVRWLLVVALTGCWSSNVVEPMASNAEPEPAHATFTITARGVGPFNADTVATAPALRKLARPMKVVARDLGGEAGVVFDIFDGRDRLFYVVPDDAPGWTDDAGEEHRYANTTFAVFGMHERVTVEGRSWRIGEPLADPAGLDICECWGDREVTACFARSTHIRVVFEERCHEAEREGPQAMVGKTIGRLMWKRTIDAEPDSETDLKITVPNGP